MLIIQRENERLRAQLVALTKLQAERSDAGGGADAAPSPTGGSTGAQSHAVLTAQLAIAEQQAVDYRSRMSKLSSYFADSMQGLRAIAHDVLGWKCVLLYVLATMLRTCSGSASCVVHCKLPTPTAKQAPTLLHLFAG